LRIVLSVLIRILAIRPERFILDDAI
jgi:hypothetical protein